MEEITWKILGKTRGRWYSQAMCWQEVMRCAAEKYTSRRAETSRSTTRDVGPKGPEKQHGQEGNIALDEIEWMMTDAKERGTGRRSQTSDNMIVLGSKLARSTRNLQNE